MEYSSNVHLIEPNDKKIFLVGTAHISQQSVDEVIQVIEAEKPDTVCVELCASRYESLINGDRWKDMDIFKVVKEKKTFLLLTNLIMASFQKKLGDQLGVKPGAEMLEAINTAKKVNAEVELVDRDVRITLQRTWRKLSFMNKVNALSQLVGGLFFQEKIDEAEIEKMKEVDILSDAMEQLSHQAPSIKKTLIDERDEYMAENIRNAPGKIIVAVVGAGHIAGIKKKFNQAHDLELLKAIPSPGKLGTFFKWGIPSLIIGLIIYGFVKVDADVSLEMIWRWFWINGSLSGLGAALAFAHPLTILTAFVAAPFTSLNPAIAAGWVAGLVELFIRKPQVRDFESLGEDISHFKGFWQNKITRILLVVIFANLGSAIGTFVGGIAIASLLR
ncbi:TraB/GumN family protein [Deltaproteobacteria bacterium TL4]